MADFLFIRGTYWLFMELIKMYKMEKPVCPLGNFFIFLFWMVLLHPIFISEREKTHFGKVKRKIWHRYQCQPKTKYIFHIFLRSLMRMQVLG